MAEARGRADLFLSPSLCLRCSHEAPNAVRVWVLLIQHNFFFFYFIPLLLLQVRYVCVDLPTSSAVRVALFRGEVRKSLRLSHRSSLEIGRKLVRMKRECVHRGERSVPENV